MVNKCRSRHHRHSYWFSLDKRTSLPGTASTPGTTMKQGSDRDGTRESPD